MTWDKVFKNGPSKILKGCLPQFCLVHFLNPIVPYLKMHLKPFQSSMMEIFLQK